MSDIKSSDDSVAEEGDSLSTKVIGVTIAVLALIGVVRFFDYTLDASKQAKIQLAESVKMGACSAVLNIAEIMDERKMDVNSPMLSQAFYDSRMPVSDSVETGLSFGIQRLGDHEFAVKFNKIATHNFPEIVKSYSHITVAQAMAHKCP